MQKCGQQEVLIEFFLRSETQIDRRFWPPIFLLRLNQNEENAFQLGPFPLMNKIKCKYADYLYIYHWRKGQTNRMPAIYKVLCDCQMFQVSFTPPLVPDRKLPFGSFLCVQNYLSFHVLSRSSTDRQVDRTRPQPWSISHSIPLNRPLYLCCGKLLKKRGGEHWS